MELLTALNHFQSKSDKAKTAPGFFKVEGEFNERVGKVNGLTKEHLLSLGNQMTKMSDCEIAKTVEFT